MSEPEAKARFKRGDVREDGRMFWCYQGTGKEYWVTPENFERKKEKLREEKQKRRKENPEKAREADKKWAEKNKEKLREYRRRHRERNLEKVLERVRKWQKLNPEKARESCRKWWAKKGRDRARKYAKNRRAQNPLFALASNLRGRVRVAFRRRNLAKPEGIENILGSTIAEAKAHIEAQFKTGMSWENYGEWHVDHIIPLASAKTPEELVALCHFTNLQPLWAYENLSKGAKMPDQPKTEKA